MGIEVFWKDEDGNILGEVYDPKNLLSRFASSPHHCQQGVCLQFLDPYGDACFNQRQIPILAKELAQAMQSVADPNLLAHLESVRALAERAISVHTYLWFIGD